MISIAQVVPGIERIGGAERQVLLLAKGLRRRGSEVSIVALSGGAGGAAGSLEADGIRFVSLGMRKGLADPRGWIRFHNWLRRERPDVVHAHLPHAVWLARWSRLAARMPVLVDTLHTSATGGLGRRMGYRWSRWLPDRVTAVSEGVAEAYINAGMVSLDKLTVLPNGVDTEEWKADYEGRDRLRRELNLGDRFVWLAAGRLDPVKDYCTLLNAFAGLEGSSLLVIAGQGKLEGDLRKQSERLGLGERVRFLGFEPNVRRWMQAADGFVLSSLWEGLPMALQEAAACALPVVATRVPGTCELVVDGQTGRLCPVGDAAAFRCAMRLMMETPEAEREAMGKRAREIVLQRYSLEAVLDRWEGLYRDLMK